MEKKWILAFLTIFGALSLTLAQEAPKKVDGIEVRSKVTRVIVYPQWAYVTREAVMNIPEGFSKFVFKGLPAWIDEDSIRISLGAGEAVIIIGASSQTVFLSRANEDEVRQAEEGVIRARDQITDLKSELASLAEEKKYLENLTPWKLGKSPQESSARTVTLAELRDLKNFIQQELLANLRQGNQIDRKIRDIEPELTAKEKIWQTIKSRGQLEQKDIIVELQAKSAVQAPLALSYLISGASWFPAYDARANSGKGRIAFACKAVVQQSTGEDWTGAAFVLSTIQPYLVREKPDIKPWYVTAATAGEEQNLPYEAAGFRSEKKEEQAQRMLAIQQKQQEWNKMDEEAQRASRAVNDNFAQALKVARLVEERGTTIEFVVPDTHTIKADGKPVNLPIGLAELEATRRYSAAPAVSRSTYVTGEMNNTADFVFLPGPVRVYIDGSFMGKSEIGCIAQGEKFDLYLGLEERIQVRRELDMQRSSTRSVDDRKRLQAAYVIDVNNYLKNPVAIEIRDQIPVSQDSSVKVKIVDLDPKVETVDKGIITWPLTLQPGEVKRLRFEFQIDYPAHILLKNALEIERMLKK